MEIRKLIPHAHTPRFMVEIKKKKNTFFHEAFWRACSSPLLYTFTEFKSTHKYYYIGTKKQTAGIDSLILHIPDTLTISY